MSKTKSLEEIAYNLLTEQKAVPAKLAIDIGDTKHDPTSPNKSHIDEDEQIDETMGTATSLGGRHNPRRTSKKLLSGKGLIRRSSLQRSGNQKRTPGMYEGVNEKVLKKVTEKKSEISLGKTATGQQGAVIDTNPEQLPLSGY